ncbi:dihydrofolate reductase family protein [Sinomonas sp. R1AF57]|uniref:dihydrofolate reductase family protein n=1 Tax=Sinomonas sp. R1AF57 TaxID=2020377 RepID=UPI000B6002D6|nr:dihydrofolate reductase family protein [Sinomonas sp. R1AF57]ASN51256.1 deaminase [Sinomonas sp. R1AF57]
MGRLLYMNLMSLDGYISDRGGRFDWAMPDEEVHAAVNDLARPVGTYLYGRRLHEVMRVWDDPGFAAGEPGVVRDFSEIWRAADKIVYSTTLTGVDTARSTLERRFEPEAVRRLKARTTADLAIGGPGLAAPGFSAGLVDEVHLFVAPVAVGGGTPALPDARMDLDLTAERRIGRFVYLSYTVRQASRE